MPDTPPLTPQAALETAVRDALRAQLGYGPADCDREFDERPPPRCGEWFVSVWSPCDRQSLSRTSLDEVYNVAVTVTGRLQRLPRDRWSEVRDELIRRIDAIRQVVHRDSLNHAIARAATALAGRGTADTRRTGFVEALALERIDRWRLVGAEWFHSAREQEAGIAQTAYFGRARLIQGLGQAR